MSRPDRTAYGLVGILTLIWGGSFALIAISLRGFHPMAVASGRVTLAALSLLAVAGLTRTPLPVSRRDWLWCAALGTFSLALPFNLISHAQQTVPSSVAAIFISGVPLFVLALSRFVFGDPVAGRQWIGFAVGLGGLVLLAGPEALARIGAAGQGPAQIACLGAALSFAIGAQITRAMPPVAPLPATIACHIAAALVTLPFGLAHLPAAMPAAAPLSALLVLGVVQTGLAQLLRYTAVRRAGPVFVSVVGYLVPISAGVIGVVILAEPLSPRAVLAYVLIIAGILMARSRPAAIGRPGRT